MMSKKLRSVIEPPSPLSTLKYRAVRETAAIAVGYHRLISEMRFGEAVDAYWDDAVVMRWADGRTFRGFGACSALIASLVHKVEMVQNVYDQPSVGAGTFVDLR